MSNEINVIADNGGGVTLQVIDDRGYKYQHSYEDVNQCAADIKEALAGADVSNWDGNEVSDENDEYWLITSDYQISNGGYREIMAVKSVADFADWTDSGWHNCNALAFLVNE